MPLLLQKALDQTLIYEIVLSQQNAGGGHGWLSVIRANGLDAVAIFPPCAVAAERLRNHISQLIFAARLEEMIRDAQFASAVGVARPLGGGEHENHGSGTAG